MPRRAATITQADVARSIRAAKQAGAESVEVQPNGCIVIKLVKPQEAAGPETPDTPLEDKPKIVL